MLAYARARMKTLRGEEEKPSVIDIYQGAWKKNGFIVIREVDREGWAVLVAEKKL